MEFPPNNRPAPAPLAGTSENKIPNKSVPQIKIDDIPNEIVSESIPTLEVSKSTEKIKKATGLSSPPSHKSESCVHTENVAIPNLLPGSEVKISENSINKMTDELNQALETFKQNKDVAALDSALQKADGRIKPLIENLYLNEPPVIKSIESYLAKFKECEKNKSSHYVDVTTTKIVDFCLGSSNIEKKRWLSALKQDPEYALISGSHPPLSLQEKKILLQKSKSLPRSGSSSHSLDAMKHTFVITDGKIPGGMPTVWLMDNSPLGSGGASFVYGATSLGRKEEKETGWP